MKQKDRACRQAGLAPILIVILIAVALGGYLLYTQQARITPLQLPLPSSTPDVSPAPTGAGGTVNPDSIGINWKTYTNNVIQFEYPQYWIVHPSENFVSINNGDYDYEMRFFLAEELPFKQSGNMTDEDKIEAHKNYWAYSTSELGDAQPKQISKSQMKIDNKKGVKYIFQLESKESKLKQAVWIYIPYKGKFINIRFAGKDGKFLDQILSTFKFIN